jgi:hypothetical protein
VGNKEKENIGSRHFYRVSPGSYGMLRGIACELFHSVPCLPVVAFKKIAAEWTKTRKLL